MANAIISKVYHDLSGHGSVKETTDATTINNSIKFSDVKEWFDNYVKSKAKSRAPIPSSQTDQINNTNST